MNQQDIDLCKVDSYAGYLAELESRNPSIAQEDIYSDFGVLLVPKGTVVSPGIVLKLSEHRMKEPLDHTIGLKTRLNKRSLHKCFEQLLDKDKELNALVDSAEFSPVLAHLCQHKEQPFSAMQKLTVIAYRLPELFRRVLGVTLLACLTARHMGWDREQIEQLFEAGLFRDVGLLHLMPPDELLKKLRYEQSHEQLQFHGMVSERILALENRFAPEVLRAVRDHHERRDGAGFPRALAGDEINDMAMVLSLMDGLWLRREQQEPWRSPLFANLIPLLKTNSYGVNSEPYRALTALLLAAGLEGDPLPEDFDYAAMSAFLLDRNLVITQLYTYLLQLAEILTDESDHLTLSTLINSNIELIRSCGFGNFEAMALLTESDPEQGYSQSELVELDLSQTELFWRISRLLGLLEKRCAEGGPLQNDEVSKQILKDMDSIVGESEDRAYLEVTYQPGRAGEDSDI